jgi:large subunit ribosomal protein L30
VVVLLAIVVAAVALAVRADLVAATTVAVEEADVAAAKTETKNVRITWVKSGIGFPQDQRDTLRSMGLTRLNQTVERPDSPQLRGQIYKVKHLLRVEED